MARRGSFRRSGISQSQRRKKTWIPISLIVGSGTVNPGFTTSIQTTISDLTIPTGGSKKAGFISVAGDGTAVNPFRSTIPTDSTILRVRGSLLFPKVVVDASGAMADGSTNPDAVPGFAFGVTSVTDLQADSYPGAQSNPDWDGWMFRRQSSVSPLDSEGTNVDVKSMRKIQDGEAFFVSTEVVRGQAVVSEVFHTWIYDLRLLVLLP